MEFSKYTHNIISETTSLGDSKNLNLTQIESIQKAIDLLGSFSVGELSERTHVEDPWRDAYVSSDWSENIVTKESIYTYYKENKIE